MSEKSSPGVLRRKHIGHFVLLARHSANKAAKESLEITGSKPVADIVLLGGTVASMDPDVLGATAVAVTEHLISAVGDDEGIAAWIGPETRVIELEGRMVIPGLIEGHGHFMSFGRSQQIIDLSDIRSWDQAIGRVARAVDRAQPGQWIFGRGWHQEKWDRVPEDAVDGVPINRTLSQVSPNNPVLLGHASGHAAFANDAALAAAGISDETPDPAGGTIIRDEYGRATGLLRETAQRLVSKVGEADQAQRPESQSVRNYERECYSRESKHSPMALPPFMTPASTSLLSISTKKWKPPKNCRYD